MGDIVIFYDGYNDIFQSLYNGDPDGTIIGNNKKIIQRKKSAFLKLKLTIWKHFHSYSVFVDHFMNPFSDRSELPENVSENTVAINCKKMKNKYYDILKNIFNKAKAGKYYFYNFLQPTIFSLKVRSQYEDDILNYSKSIYPGIDYVFEYGYDGLRNTFNELNNSNTFSYDISHCLDSVERKQGQEFYIDQCHINHRGNDIVAQQIFGCLRGNISEWPKTPSSPLQ